LPPDPAQGPIEIPPTFPNNYPSWLEVKTENAVLDATKAFPDKRQILGLCGRVLSILTPAFCAGVQARRHEEASARADMDNLLGHLLHFNSRDSERVRLRQEIKRMEEWSNFLRQLEESEQIAALRIVSKSLPGSPSVNSKPTTVPPLVTHSVQFEKEADVSRESLPIRNGQRCAKLIDQIKHVRYMYLDTGRTMAEIQQDSPDGEIWKVIKNLPAEDQETFAHPNRWGPVVGYGHGLLAKEYRKSPATIRDWIKTYRQKQGKKSQE
jgi:hypothetical protein